MSIHLNSGDFFIAESTIGCQCRLNATKKRLPTRGSLFNLSKLMLQPSEADGIINKYLATVHSLQSNRISKKSFFVSPILRRAFFKINSGTGEI